MPGVPISQVEADTGLIACDMSQNQRIYAHAQIGCNAVTLQ